MKYIGTIQTKEEIVKNSSKKNKKLNNEDRINILEKNFKSLEKKYNKLLELYTNGNN